MSEEDLIKKKLAELFTEALLSDAARDTRSNFSGRIASEFLERISETMGVHQNGLREETQKLTEVLKAMASERAELESVVDRFAAAPIAKAGVEELHGAPSGGFGEGEEPKANLAQKAGRGGEIVPNFGKSDDAGKLSSSPSPKESGEGRFSYLIEAPIAYKVWLGIVALVLGALIFTLGVLKISSSKSENRADADNLELICQTFREYKKAPSAAPPADTPTGLPSGGGTQNAEQGTGVQDQVIGSPTNPFASVENVLARKCHPAGAGDQPVVANPSGSVVPGATSSGASATGAGTTTPSQ